LDEVPDFKGVFVREDKRKPVIIPEEDFVALVKAVSKPGLSLSRRPANWWQAFLYVAYYLGLRRGEILGLTWDRVSFERLEVVVVAHTSKGRKDRVVPMVSAMAQILKDWQQQTVGDRQTEVLPWPYDDYGPLYDDWHVIQTAAGIPDGRHYLPKNCRSSCASLLIASGASTVAVKDILGHRSVTTTEDYYINTKPALRSAVAAREVKIVE
jgi:integrase